MWFPIDVSLLDKNWPNTTNRSDRLFFSGVASGKELSSTVVLLLCVYVVCIAGCPSCVVFGVKMWALTSVWSVMLLMHLLIPCTRVSWTYLTSSSSCKNLHLLDLKRFGKVDMRKSVSVHLPWDYRFEFYGTQTFQNLVATVGGFVWSLISKLQNLLRCALPDIWLWKKKKKPLHLLNLPRAKFFRSSPLPNWKFCAK